MEAARAKMILKKKGEGKGDEKHNNKPPLLKAPPEQGKKGGSAVA